MAGDAPRDDPPDEATSTGGTALDDEGLTYERARDELAEVVRRLEEGGTTLEESLALWERGERLATICEEWLAGARERLAEAVQARAGETSDPGRVN
ncbi:MAG: exodeoxyribonuclease VII small subunit [Streptosporangiaceae bacterium]